jgi:hypothetical protein
VRELLLGEIGPNPVLTDMSRALMSMHRCLPDLSEPMIFVFGSATRLLVVFTTWMATGQR